MSSPVQGKRRMDTDVIKLIESKHEVSLRVFLIVKQRIDQLFIHIFR